jgi:hypothetical protein
MADDKLSLAQPEKLSAVLRLLLSDDLDEVFLRFCDLTGATPDLRCLIPVAANLHIYFKLENNLWRSTRCFARWPELVEFIVQNANEIQRLIGDYVFPQQPVTRHASNQQPRNPMYGEITQYPIFAMLCDQHARPDLRRDYAALQMQFLYAQWLEREVAKRQLKNSGRSNVTAVEGSAVSERMTRLPAPYARAIRDLSEVRFVPLLEHLAPSCSPRHFRAHLRKALPYFAQDFSSQFVRIRAYRDKWRPARNDGPRSSGDRRQPRPTHPESVFYNEHLFGFTHTPSSEDDEDTVIHELLHRRSFSVEDALELGLAPEELTGSDLLVNAEVPDAADRYEALVASHDKARSFEFERRLFPWNSEALRLEEMHFDLLPAFENAVQDTSLNEDSLAGLLINAIIIETGRGIDDALSLKIVREPRSAFGFQNPASDDPNGYWIWPAIGPDYASKWDAPVDTEAPRASVLRYRASQLVTYLILRFCRLSRIQAGQLFRGAYDYKRLAHEWMTQHNPRKRYTFTRLANLRWGLLHQLTDGDLVTACLTLGVRNQGASVQLHYGVAELGETRRLFEETSSLLWKSDRLPEIVNPATDNLLIGCRAFPRIDHVRDVVEWLRSGSMLFFAVSPSELSPATHRDYLNRAVLYLIWHQFFSFGTRAIKDAYLDSDDLAASTGVGILSDKDFADGYKTRVIWASEGLRKHMTVVEQRLSAIDAEHNFMSDKNGSRVWFLDDQDRTLPITPTEIKRIFGDKFVYPVNTPRKVARHLLRTSGMSYECAEVFMGHWPHGREPWSSLSTFDYGEFIRELKQHVPGWLEDLGFNWIPGEISR